MRHGKPLRASSVALIGETVALFEENPPQLVQVTERLEPQLRCRPCPPCPIQSLQSFTTRSGFFAFVLFGHRREARGRVQITVSGKEAEKTCSRLCDSPIL